MKIKQISYQRVFNLGNSEFERIELIASIGEDDESQAEIICEYEKLKALVQYMHEEIE